MRIVQRKSARPQAAERRPGFTLIELLVVMTIIAVLVSLTASATMRLISVQQEKAAQTLVTKISSALDKHWKAVIARANNESYDKFPSQLITLAGGDMQRARVIWIKLRLKQEFPMSFDEITNPIPNWMPALQTYRAAIPATVGTLEAQNSSCLLLALSQARGGIITNLEDFGANAINDTDGNGLKEFVDSWNKPIVFCRWPTANPEVDSSNPARTGTSATTFRDPEDPKGKLLDITWNNANWNAFDNSLQLHSIRLPPQGGTNSRPHAYYTTPVVWSAGPDKKYGFSTFDYLHLRNMNLNAAPDTYDNIYSYRLRIGGN
jgi:prepilin-type N-terminal cleavage/methylation domain-containing protein